MHQPFNPWLVSTLKRGPADCTLSGKNIVLEGSSLKPMLNLHRDLKPQNLDMYVKFNVDSKFTSKMLRSCV